MNTNRRMRSLSFYGFDRSFNRMAHFYEPLIIVDVELLQYSTEERFKNLLLAKIDRSIEKLETLKSRLLLTYLERGYDGDR